MQKSTYSNIQISLKWLLTAYYRKVMQSKRYLLSYLVTFSLLLAPFQQSIPLGAPILPSQGCQGVLSLHTKPGKKAEDNKYTWNIFDFYQCVNNICMTKQNGSTEHEHKPNWTRFWSLHLVFSFTQGKFRWCHCTWRGEKIEPVDIQWCVLTKHFCYYFHQLYLYNLQAISLFYILKMKI